MIKNIGMSRITFIFVLFLMNVSLLGVAHFYFLPKEEMKSREVSTVKSGTRTKYSEVVQLREDFALLKDRLTSFSALELSGFFENQNRLKARREVELFRERSKLLKVSMDIGAGDVEEDAVAAQAGHVLLKSPFSIDIDAQDDADVMYFIKMMQKKFPGIVKFKTLEMKRTQNLDAPLLRLIGTGTPTPLVQATLQMEWITMPSKEDVK